ncbi:hypothetical protein Tco_0612347, partial [Tanacetum coccineum]
MISKCMSWLDVYDEPIGYIEDKVDNLSPQSTPQVLPSFEVYTPPVTYLEKVDEAIGIPMEVDPLDHTKLEDLGLNHDLFLSSKEIPSVDEPEPQLLPNFSPLDVNLGDKRGTDPPINPYSPVNTKFLNSLQLEWLKYVTQVCLAKRLTVDSFDDLFNYLQQFEKLFNASRVKKLEKSNDPLALVAHTGSSSRNTSSYYVTHPTSVVNYDDEYQQDDDEVGVILTDEQNDFLFADALRMDEIEELSANICLMVIIQPANNTSDAGPSYDSAFISE